MKVGSIIKDAIILCIVTLILGLALSGVKVATQDSIDKVALDAKLKAFSIVCPGYESSENITDDLLGASAGLTEIARFTNDEGVLRCKDKDGNNIGYIVQSTADGYGGDLNLIIGFDTKGNITGVAYANTPSETPGLGMKTTKSSFLDSFKGYNNDNIEQVDTISGATISSTAFKEAVKMACGFVNRAVTMDGGAK